MHESSLEKSEQHMLMKARVKTKNNWLRPKKYPLLIFISSKNRYIGHIDVSDRHHQ